MAWESLPIPSAAVLAGNDNAHSGA
jgi:hypothetical protein